MSETIVKTVATLSITSVVLFMTTMILANILNKFLPKYNPKQIYILNLLKLSLCVIATTILGYFVRQIPSLVPLPFLKTDNFDPKSVKEVKGTILVAPAFVFLIGGTLKEYLPLFKF